MARIPNNEALRTPGLRLINYFNFANLVFQYGIGPLLTIFFLVFVRLENNFGGRLIFSLGLVYVLGGFFFLTTKVWEVWDTNYTLHMRSKWKANPIMRKIHYKLVIPKDFDRPVADMIGLFGELWTINGGARTKYEIYNEGKWYYDFTFDTIIRSGKIEMYLTFPFKRKDMVLKAFFNRYPEIKLVECPDPYRNWPKQWIEGVGVPGYKDFHGSDYMLLLPDLYPLADPVWFSSPEAPSNPYAEMLKSMRDFDPKTTIIFQHIFRAFDKIHEDRWWKELEEAKATELSKSTFFQVKDIETGRMKTATTGDLVTQKQKDIFDRVAQKLNNVHYRCHCRFMVFYPENKEYYGPILEKFIKTFAGQTGGDNQVLAKNWYSATDRFFLSTKFGLWDGLIGPIMNKVYHSKEVEWRKICLYDGLLSRDLDISHDSNLMLIDITSIASMFHFPTEIGIFEDLINPKPETVNPQTAKSDNQFQSFTKLQELRQKAQNNPEYANLNISNQNTSYTGNSNF